jgi:drug/metabolite transporter (DMT)-like permease
MSTFLTILLGASLFAVIGALFFGLYTLLRGGEFNEKYSNEAMRWRVILQGIALLIFFLILWWGRR